MRGAGGMFTVGNLTSAYLPLQKYTWEPYHKVTPEVAGAGILEFDLKWRAPSLLQLLFVVTIERLCDDLKVGGTTTSTWTRRSQTVSEGVLDVQTFFVCNLLLKLFINAGFDLDKPETNALHCLVGSVSNPENCERLYVAFRLLEQHPNLKFSEKTFSHHWF